MAEENAEELLTQKHKEERKQLQGTNCVHYSNFSNYLKCHSTSI